MAGRRGSRPGSETADTVIRFAAVSHGKILRLTAFVALLLVVALPLLFWDDMPSVAANSTLKCHDTLGNDIPCVTQASASPSRSTTGRATETRQPAGRTATAPYQPASWAAAAVDQPATWIATAPYQEANWATTAVEQPADWATTAPAAPRSGTPLKRPASASCKRRLLPCFFSSLRKGIKHIASAVAAAGQAPAAARERL
jgi:hypothetical protein